MPEAEKRKYPRIKIYNVISYICTDEDGNQLGEGMGEAMNISQGGILLKTPLPIESEYILLTTIDLENNTIDIKGKIAHSQRDESGKFETGIRFLGTHEEKIQIVKSLVKTRVR
jgi:c-di-GMP-binding flagellar brake protein YcgR